MLDSLQLIALTPAYEQWQKVGIRNHHGINVALFSIHSSKCSGIGEYLDLIPLVQWCYEVGMDTIQLLPLNDTGHETSPYSALSAFALNPIHLRLSELPNIEAYEPLLKILKQLKETEHPLRVQYEQVRKLKEEFLTLYINQNKETFIEDSAYQHFCQNMTWLENYALYKTLKEIYSWSSWEQWPEEVQVPTESVLAELKEKHKDQITFHSIVQYLCFSQMWEVKSFAEKHGVLIKGDIPILINRDSADVWLHRYIFDLHLCAGAPPDFYSPTGQNWGVPLYSWGEQSPALYLWWKERLLCAESLYHVYRIDHIIGFFRIWAVLPGQPGTCGHFTPSEWDKWIPQGERKLRMMLKSTNMLPIGEDLGAISPTIRSCLSRLGICGTKVIRWERDWLGNRDFIDPKTFSPLSLTTISTHDSELMRQWWIDYPDDSKAFAASRGWQWAPEVTPEQLILMLAESHASGSLFHINILQEYLSVFPELTWPAPEMDRINVPGIVTDKNWSVKTKASLEEITEHRMLKAIVKDMIKK